MRRKKTFSNWLLEFSKKVVVMCVLVYVAIHIYSGAAMWHFGEISALQIMISESSDVLKTCVFGYFVKAGLENWQKIKRSNSEAKGEITNEN